MYGHTLEWRANEDGAKGLGQEIAKAVTETESNCDSGPLSAHQKENFQTQDLEVIDNAYEIWLRGQDLNLRP